MISYKIVYNEDFQPEAVRSIKENWPNSVSPITIVPLSKDADNESISLTIQQLKDRETPQLQ